MPGIVHRLTKRFQTLGVARNRPLDFKNGGNFLVLTDDAEIDSAALEHDRVHVMAQALQQVLDHILAVAFRKPGDRANPLDQLLCAEDRRQDRLRNSLIRGHGILDPWRRRRLWQYGRLGGR